ncbi:MAG: hypothetical protein POELPBGB_02861 [Bacteroidia bacterium]|jgi:uncharacterized RDD family membrane protein YckC|nr:hypothetical protein [Bacteroidia bacterium]
MENPQDINKQPLDYTKPAPAQDAVVEADEYPSISTRIQALFIDLVIMLLIFTLTAYLINLAGGAPAWLRGGILITMFFLYDPLAIAFFGGTLGHYAVGIRVKRSNNQSKNVLLPLTFLRFFFKTMLGWLSFLTVTANSRRRAIHDMVSGSVVIKVNTNSEQS